MSSGEGGTAGDADICEARLWRKNGWTARVIKNEDDDGWAVEMTRKGDDEPALVGPWTMGRDKKNPKPLDAAAFLVLVKTASEVIRRAEQAAAPRRVSQAVVDGQGRRWRVECVDVHDEDDPHARLTLTDSAGTVRREWRERLGFKLDAGKAADFVREGGA
jgi:hypothetical protein